MLTKNSNVTVKFTGVDFGEYSPKVSEFVGCLLEVVKHSERGAITRIANNAGLNRANLYDILNGKVTPRIDTAFKLIRGLGYKYDIKLQSA